MPSIYKKIGRKNGQRHHRAIYPDSLVAAIRAAHCPGVVGYEKLSARFGVPLSTVRDICTFRTRP